MMVAAVVTMVVMVGLIGCGVVWYHRLIAGGAGRGRRVPISSPTRILTP